MPIKPVIAVSNRNNLFAHLMNKTFIIPEYQRFYEWDDGLIYQFLIDIESSLKNKINLFFGIFVFKSEGHNTCVIDGQQRIITFLIFLRSLIGADKLYANEKNIFNDFLKGISIGIKPIVTLNEKNRRNFFNNFILNGNESLKENVDSKKMQIERIIKCKQIFDLELSKKRKNEIRKMWDFAYYHIEMTYIDITNDAEESEIFESINAKKLSLSDVDLLKNYFLSRCKKEKTLNDAIKKWNHINYKLGESKDVEKYFNTYLTMKYGEIKDTEINYSEYKLYHKFKTRKDISKCNDHINILRDLENASKEYYKIINPLEKDWPSNSTGKEIYHSLQYLAYLNFETPYPLLLRVMKEIKPHYKEILDMVKLCEISSFLRIVIQQQYPQEVKNYYNSKLKRLIDNRNRMKDFIKIINEMKGDIKRLRTDTEIIENLKNTSFTKSRYIIYLLYRIMLSKSKTTFKPSDINSYKDKSREHIMPKSLLDWWKIEIDKIIKKDQHIKDLFYREFTIAGNSLQKKIKIYHKHFLNLIGNSSLLSKSDNKFTGNKSFQEKKRIYRDKESANPLFSDIIIEKNWDYKTINKRSELLINNYFDIFI